MSPNKAKHASSNVYVQLIWHHMHVFHPALQISIQSLWHISQYVTFSHGNTRSAFHNKHHKYSTNTYFVTPTFVDYNLEYPATYGSKQTPHYAQIFQLSKHFATILWLTLNQKIHVLTILSCPCWNCYSNFQIINLTV